MTNPIVLKPKKIILRALKFSLTVILYMILWGKKKQIMEDVIILKF